MLDHVPGGDRRTREVAQFPANKLDFDILDLTAGEMESYANALNDAASLDPVKTFPPYLGFAKATQEWLAQNTDEQRGRDARARVRAAVADLLPVIIRARTDRGLASLEAEDLTLIQKLAALGYADVFGPGLGLANKESKSRVAAVTEALKRFQGNPDDPSQRGAFETIIARLDDSPAAKSLVDGVVVTFVKADSDHSSYYTRFLIAAADARALSPGLINKLLVQTRADLAKPETDFEDSEHAQFSLMRWDNFQKRIGRRRLD